MIIPSLFRHWITEDKLNGLIRGSLNFLLHLPTLDFPRPPPLHCVSTFILWQPSNVREFNKCKDSEFCKTARMSRHRLWLWTTKFGNTFNMGPQQKFESVNSLELWVWKQVRSYGWERKQMNSHLASTELRLNFFLHYIHHLIQALEQKFNFLFSKYQKGYLKFYTT